MQDREYTILLDTFRKLIRRKAKPNIIRILKKTHSADVVEIFRSFTPDEQLFIFNAIPTLEYKADLLTDLEETYVIELLAVTPPEHIVEILGEMAPDDQADIVAYLDEELEVKVLDLMKDKESKKLEELMMYPPETAGGIMVPLPFKMNEDETVKDAIAAVHNQVDMEMIFYIYVIDEFKKLCGILSLRELLTAKPNVMLKDIMSTKILSVSPETDQEEVAHITSRYDLLALPVVDKDNILLGIVTVDDIIDVIRQEATEDFLQMAGVGKDGEILLKTPWEATKIRLPWLFATFLGGVLASKIVMNFEFLVEQFALLAAFMPIVAGMGGNVGTQSSTIIVRGISTGRIDFKHLGKVFLRQLIIGSILGVFYGLLLATFTFFFFNSQANVILISLSIGVSLTFSMLIAASTGTITPILLDRFNIDPAVATGPIVTTVVDVIGILVYFLTATMFLSTIL